MKLILLVYGGSTPDRVVAMLERCPTAAWTRLDDAHGVGASGRREGTRAWPGGNTLFFTTVPVETADRLLGLIRAEAAALPEGERLRAAVLPVETFI